MTVDKPDGPRRSQSFKETSKKTRSKIHQGADPISDTKITDETYAGSSVPRLRAQSIHKPVASARNQSKSSKRRSSLPSCSFKNYLSVPTTCPTMSEGNSEGSDESLRRVSSLKENLRADGKREREPLRRVRSFKTTSKGLINHGDSFKRKQGNCTPVLLFDSDGTNSTGECVESGIIPTVSIERETTRAQTEPANYFFRVLMLGAPGVGKSSLTNQFMTSEYLGTSDFGICKYLLFR
ncbi:hypothetical protein ACJMK2_009123 [Sinanodonta woodiana]|uniref:Uncharacterized protein n=1 Tax=Sinanodonta woodiana TaxID=1069815 RepID=A0ABD3VBA9_SINWO